MHGVINSILSLGILAPVIGPERELDAAHVAQALLEHGLQRSARRLGQVPQQEDEQVLLGPKVAPIPVQTHTPTSGAARTAVCRTAGHLLGFALCKPLSARRAHQLKILLMTSSLSLSLTSTSPAPTTASVQCSPKNFTVATIVHVRALHTRDLGRRAALGDALSQKAAAAASRPSSRASAVYTLMGGHDLAPHTRAKWMRGSSGITTWRKPTVKSCCCLACYLTASVHCLKPASLTAWLLCNDISPPLWDKHASYVGHDALTRGKRTQFVHALGTLGQAESHVAARLCCPLFTHAYQNALSACLSGVQGQGRTCGRRGSPLPNVLPANCGRPSSTNGDAGLAALPRSTPCSMSFAARARKALSTICDCQRKQLSPAMQWLCTAGQTWAVLSSLVTKMSMED